MKGHPLGLARPWPLLALHSVRRLVLVLLLAALVAGHGLWLGALGDQLVLVDPLEPADAIIVLAGHSPDRARHALELYQAGYAARLIISDEQVYTHALDTTWGDLYRRGIVRLPVPAEAVEVLPISFSTYEEALYGRDLLLQAGLRSAILVTDAFHSRRARMVFARVFEPAGLFVRSSPADNAAKGVKQWWLDGRKAWGVLTEYAKLASYALQGRLF